MKKLVITLIAVTGLAVSTVAQGTITIDNLNGAGGNTATDHGLFFDSAGAVYTGPNINIQVLGGLAAGSLSEIATLMGANALFYSTVPGVYLDPTFATYNVPNSTGAGTAVLQVLAWTGTASSFASAATDEQFWAWDGNAYVNPTSFTFQNAMGGPQAGLPDAPPASLDGMPAMQLALIPEPSIIALAGLGLASLLAFRRRN